MMTECPGITPNDDLSLANQMNLKLEVFGRELDVCHSPLYHNYLEKLYRENDKFMLN